MGFAGSGVVPLTQTRANFCGLAGRAMAGGEKIITRTGVRDVALTDADRLDCDRGSERERIYRLLIADAQRALADIQAGRTLEADGAIAEGLGLFKQTGAGPG